MKRSVLILIGALTVGVAVFAGSYFTARHTTLACCAKPSDNLDWLRTEFHLDDTEMARIRTLHEGYKPKCAEICAKIAAKKTEMDALNSDSTNFAAEMRVKMDEIAALRSQCQTQMIQHFVAVSQAMPPAEGQRYLGQMKELTLGHHEEMEQSMSGDTGHEHHP